MSLKGKTVYNVFYIKWLRLIIKNVIFNVIYSEMQSVKIKIILIHIDSLWNKILRPYENSFPSRKLIIFFNMFLSVILNKGKKNPF